MDVLKKLSAKLPDRNPMMKGERLQIDVGGTQLLASTIEGVGDNKGSTAVILELPHTFETPGLVQFWGHTGKLLVKSVLAFLDTLPEDFPDADPEYWSALAAVTAHLNDLSVERVVTRHTNAHLVLRQSHSVVVVVSVYGRLRDIGEGMPFAEHPARKLEVELFVAIEPGETVAGNEWSSCNGLLLGEYQLSSDKAAAARVRKVIADIPSLKGALERALLEETDEVSIDDSYGEDPGDAAEPGDDGYGWEDSDDDQPVVAGVAFTVDLPRARSGLLHG